LSEENNIHEPDETENGMSFLDHLEELRWRIVKSVIGIVAGGAIAAFFIDWIMNSILLRPSTLTNPPLSLQNLKPYGQFSLYMEVIITCGVILSIPNLLYQIWKFIEPALKPNEKKYVSSIVIFSSICFLTGIAFAYFVMLPTSLGFFAQFGSTIIKNNIAADEYYDFVFSVLLTAGCVFELPMVSFFLARIGILTPQFMRKYRKHAIVAILLVAGIITPTPDVTNQLLLGIPLFLLYEISIFICVFAQKKRKKETLLLEDTPGDIEP
jgi:sec-independent protein translocase protein TatC